MHGAVKHLLAIIVTVTLLATGILPASSEPSSGANGNPRAAGLVTPITTGIEDSLYCLDFNPVDGSAIIAGNNGTILRYNQTTGLSNHQQNTSYSFREVAFRPDNSSILALLVGSEEKMPPPAVSLAMVYDGSSFSRITTSAYRAFTGIAWSSDGARAFLTAKKGIDGAILKYEAGALTEVLVDTVHEFYGIAAGNGTYFVHGFDFDNQSSSLQLFNGTAITGEIPMPSKTDYSLQDIGYSAVKQYGLLPGFGARILKFTNVSVSEISGSALKGDLTGCGWAAGGKLALATGADNANLNETNGLLFSYDGTALTVESQNTYFPLTDAAFSPGDKYALITGENGTLLRFTTAAGINTKPICVITAPHWGNVVNSTVTVTGTAEDLDNDTIESVKVRIDNGVWEDATGTNNWSYQWDTGSVPNGQHHIWARSNDGLEDSIAADVMVIINNPNRPPETIITSPSENADVVGNVTVSGTASDPDAGDAVTRVQVRIDDTTWVLATGTLNWSYIWDTTMYADGAHRVWACSNDGELNSTEVYKNANIVNHGPNSPPVCSILSPAQNTVVAGTVQVQGSAQDADNGVVAVYIRMDSGVWQTAYGNTSWSYGWDTGPVPGGSHILTARASDGIVNSSDAKVTLNVNHPPAVTITAPVASATVTGEVTVQGSANDPDMTDSVQYVNVRIDGGNWLTATGTSAWVYKWNTTGISQGQHTITARCSDGKHDSPEVSRSVTVEKPPSPVLVSLPDEVGENYVVVYWSRNMDADFLRYEVFTADRENAPVTSLYPKTIPGQSVTTTNITGLLGRTTYWFRVRVVDTSGLTAISNEVYATTLRENLPPLAIITASRNSASTGDSISFSAEGSYDQDRGGRIVKYEWDFDGKGRFPVNTGSLGTQRHEFPSAGKFLIQVRVTDDRGATAIGALNVTIAAKSTGSVDAGTVGILVVVLAIAAAIGYFLWRSKTAPIDTPHVEETYYEEEVVRPARKRRRQSWEDTNPAPRKKKRIVR